MNRPCRGCALWKVFGDNCWFWYQDKQDCLSSIYKTAGGLDKKVKNTINSSI